MKDWKCSYINNFEKKLQKCKAISQPAWCIRHKNKKIATILSAVFRGSFSNSRRDWTATSQTPQPPEHLNFPNTATPRTPQLSEYRNLPNTATSGTPQRPEYRNLLNTSTSWTPQLPEHRNLPNTQPPEHLNFPNTATPRTPQSSEHLDLMDKSIYWDTAKENVLLCVSPVSSWLLAQTHRFTPVSCPQLRANSSPPTDMKM